MLKLEILSGIWKLDSWIPGKVVTIMAGMDGKDQTWVQELLNIMDDIELISGKLYCIIANPEALKRWVHQLEKSMDQTFLEIPTSSTDEDLRTQDIIPFLRESDILLTLEQSTSEEKIESFLCLWDIAWAGFFDVKHIITWLETLKPARSESYMWLLWKTWIYMSRWKEKRWMSKKEIHNFLTATKNIQGETILYTKQKRYHLDTLLRAPNTDFRFSKKWKNFDTVEAWEPIAYHEEVTIRAPYTGIIAFAKIPTHIWDEMCVFGREIVS